MDAYPKRFPHVRTLTDSKIRSKLQYPAGFVSQETHMASMAT